MTTHYFNASDVLPQRVIDDLLAHLPPDRRDRVLLYVHTDYYAARNAEVVAAYERELAEDPRRRRGPLYAALGKRFSLSARRIRSIIRSAEAAGNTRRAGEPPATDRTQPLGRSREGVSPWPSGKGVISPQPARGLRGRSDPWPVKV